MGGSNGKVIQKSGLADVNPFDPIYDADIYKNKHPGGKQEENESDQETVVPDVEEEEERDEEKKGKEMVEINKGNSNSSKKVPQGKEE